jgi:acid stress-induced BolA-like protein IbaG/YrbA
MPYYFVKFSSTALTDVFRVPVMTSNDMKDRIESAIEGAEALIETDGQHFEAVVVAEAFQGLPRVKQHRMVYDALRAELKDEVHALALKTYTPKTWADQRRAD